VLLCRGCSTDLVRSLGQAITRATSKVGQAMAHVVVHMEGPPGAPDDWGGEKCTCGHGRRHHLHGRQHCLSCPPVPHGRICACKSFTPEAP
jgi:hypothetical protein